MMALETTEFDVAEYLTEWEDRCALLMDSIESGDIEAIKLARDTILRAIEYHKEAK